MTIQLEARNASLNDAVAMLTEQAAHKVDVVTPMGALTAHEGTVILSGVEPVMDESGVTDPNGSYRPTHIGDDSIAARLGIPTPYMRRLRGNGNIPLWDANVNHWLEQEPDRKVLLRMFATSQGETGILRSMSSDRFKAIDNLDNVLAILGGLKDAGIEFTVSGFNITERRMSFNVEAPDIRVAATTLLKDYRSPFSGKPASELPWVTAGFTFGNSETGNGSLSAAPRAKVLVCNNGMTRNVDLFRAVHLGGRLEEGVIEWGDDTQSASIALISKQVRDTVLTYCSAEYLQSWIDEMEEKAATPILDPAKAVKVIARRAGFSETEAQGILSHFIGGGQATAGGFMQATTSYAQVVESPDRAVELEARAMQVLDVAAALTH